MSAKNASCPVPGSSLAALAFAAFLGCSSTDSPGVGSATAGGAGFSAGGGVAASPGAAGQSAAG
ncbi:MAG TPA: hypothetical protein VGC79_00755, partial [Polyangiaceae bacterium]